MRGKSYPTPHQLTALETATVSWELLFPRAPAFSDIYYSKNNGLAESQHVFINANQLPERWKTLAKRTSFTIAETGFGTGLNFLAAATLWLANTPKSCCLQYLSIEKFPLRRTDLSKALSAWPELAALAEQLITQYPPPLPGFHRINIGDAENNQRIALTLVFADLGEALPDLQAINRSDCKSLNQFAVDAWFLDGFAPAKNPDMWSDLLFESMASLSTSDTTFSTFTSAVAIRKGLEQAGFEVQKTVGYGNKRDMLCGTFSAESTNRNSYGQLVGKAKNRNSSYTSPWHICSSTSTAQKNRPRAREAAIIGGGIAGCATALALAKRGWQVRIYEKEPSLATGASGNSQGIIYPRLSPEASLFSYFNLTALAFAARFYAEFWQRKPDGGHPLMGERCGVLMLPSKESDFDRFARIAQNFRNCSDFVRYLDGAQIKAVSGLPLNADCALFFQQLGWISPRSICQQLVRHNNIQVHQADVTSLFLDSAKNRWSLATNSSSPLPSADIVVIATGNNITRLAQTQHLPVRTVRGQISRAPATTASKQLRTVVCGAGYLAPAFEEQHTFGATYEPGATQTTVSNSNHLDNLTTLKNTDPVLPALLGEPDIDSLNGRAGLRCTTPDFLPIVGQAPVYEEFIRDFAPLRDDARADIPLLGSYWQGLYIHSGLGSRGYSYAPLGAELLASQIDFAPPPLSIDLQIAVNPARFIIRDLKRNRV
jgi:tRNA 5-methylaminomethyl-2-thiouridine biosynthesis bifunctional protein